MRDSLVVWICLAFVCFFGGQAARDARWFSYLHEWGHKWAAEQEGKRATIDSSYHTTVYGTMTDTIRVSGQWAELLVWSAVAIGLAFARWNGFAGAACGFALGFATRVYGAAFYQTDFLEAGTAIFVQWRFYGVLTLLAVYLTVGIRLWKWWRQDGTRSHYRAPERIDTDQG